MDVARQIRKAMKPVFNDELVVDVGDESHNYSYGVSLVQFGNNEHGFSVSEHPASVRVRSAYTREMFNHSNLQAATAVFNQIRVAKTEGEIQTILGTPMEEGNVWSKAAVSVRHTREGNFVGGAFIPLRRRSCGE